MQAIHDVVSGETARTSALPEDRVALRQSFTENGYVILPAVVPKPPLAELAAMLVDVFEQTKRAGTLFSAGGTMTGHLNCFPGRTSRFVYDAFEQHGVIDLINAVAPRPFGAFHIGCNLNLPRSVVQHYHIDGQFEDEFTVVNTAIVDTNLENGAIEVIPGSHRKEYPYWRFAVERPYRFGKRLMMRQGDVLVRTSRLWHRGMPNRTQAARPMLAMNFTKGSGGANPVDPFLFNDGNVKFYENWFRTDWRGRLRERTFLAAPFTYAAYRFVASLLPKKRNGATEST